MWCSETTDGEAADLTRLLTTQSPEGDPDAKSETSLPYDGVARKEIVSAACCGKWTCNSGPARRLLAPLAISPRTEQANVVQVRKADRSSKHFSKRFPALTHYLG